MTIVEIEAWLAEGPKDRYWGKHECWKPADDGMGYQYHEDPVMTWSTPIYTTGKVTEKPDFTRGPQVAFWFGNKKKTRRRGTGAHGFHLLRSINIVSLPQSKHLCNWMF